MMDAEGGRELPSEREVQNMMQTQTIHYIPQSVHNAATLRVAAYCRVSSDSIDQLESYAAQLEYYDQLIRSTPSWELIDLYADEGLTGTKADTREDFQRLLQDCRKGLIDKVLVKSISRFARNTRDCLAAVRELKSLGVSVFFEAQNIDTGSMGGEMMLAYYGAQAQQESMSISNNMRWSYQRRMESGEFITCYAPYGYSLAGSNELLIYEPEAENVCFIFERYLAGDGVHMIANSLNQAGIPTRVEGSAWNAASIRFILKNEKYIGDSLLQKSYLTDGFPFERKPNRGEKTQYYVEHTHPAIIPKESYLRVQSLMARKTQTAAPPEKYAFSKKISCGKCGRLFKRRLSSGSAYWICYNHYENKDNCPTMPVAQDVLEQAFLRLHQKLRNNHQTILAPMLEQLSTLQQRSTMQQERLAEIDREVTNIGRQSMILHRLHGQGRMDAAFYYAQSQNLNQQVNILRRERRNLLENAEDESIEQTATLIDAIKNSPKQLDAFDPELFHSIVQKIIVPDQSKVQFELINGLVVTECL